MGISDIFRPKHKHSDPDVRAEAVRALTADDTETLLGIAREDEDREVRRLAIERLADPEALAEVARAESEAALAAAAARRAGEMWVARALEAPVPQAIEIVGRLAHLDDTHGLADLAVRAREPAVRDAALDEIRDARALADVARSAAPPQLRIVAIGRISDAEVLRAIAVDEQDKSIALAALDRIADPALLEVVAAKAKAKAVRARARKTLTDMGREETPDDRAAEEKRVHAERVQLCRVAESITGRHEWIEAAAELDRAEAAWRELGPSDDAELAERFTAAVTRYRERRAKYGAEAVAAAEAKAAEVVVTEPAVTEPVAAEPVTAEPASDAVPAPVADVPTAPAAPRSEPAPGDEPGHDHKHDHASARAESLAALERIVAELEDLDGLKKLKTAEKKLTKTQAAFDGLNPRPHGARADELVTRYHAAHKALFIKIQEMREADEWKRWANVPKREELVAKAKAMLEGDARPDLGKQLKDLQTAWKEVGPVPQKRGQELWDEFKAACDQVYARVKDVRAHLGEERKANMEAKQALCEKVEALMDSTDWAATADEIKRLQSEWKQIGPVPRKHADVLWKRFRGACDHFFERRKPHLEQAMGEQQKNLERKQALCEEAEALAESTDWREAAEALKGLQRDWKRVGHVPRRDFDAINKRFRGACDAFFARREAHYKELEAEQDRKLDELSQRLDAVLTGGGEVTDRVTELLALRTEVLAARGSRQRLAALGETLRAAQYAVAEAHPAELAGTELDPAVSARRMAKLVARAEELAPSEAAASNKPLSAAEMAERLKQALSNNALGGVLSKTGGRPIRDLVAELEDSWARLGPVPGEEGAALAQRFRAACERSLQSAE